eukprot:scaffold1397_cov254-Pinguiococcus_pyrenoidosus.AAC.41
MLIEMILVADASIVQLGNLRAKVPYELPPKTLINTTIPYPTCDPLHPTIYVPINVTTEDACEADPDLPYCGEVVGCTAFPFSQPEFPIHTVFIAATGLSALRAYTSGSYSAFRYAKRAWFRAGPTSLLTPEQSGCARSVLSSWRARSYRRSWQPIRDSRLRTCGTPRPAADFYRTTTATRFSSSTRATTMQTDTAPTDSTAILGLSVFLVIAARCTPGNISFLDTSERHQQKLQAATERLLNGDDSDESVEGTGVVFEPEAEEIA